jgi:hypothetical protein
MLNEVIVREEEVSTPVRVKPEEVLAKVVDAVRRDSQESAAAFLAETVVPHGGE